jgi:hypothetical protein
MLQWVVVRADDGEGFFLEGLAQIGGAQVVLHFADEDALTGWIDYVVPYALSECLRKEGGPEVALLSAIRRAAGKLDVAETPPEVAQVIAEAIKQAGLTVVKQQEAEQVTGRFGLVER